MQQPESKRVVVLIFHRLSSSSGCLVGLSAALLRCRLPVGMMLGGLLKARQCSVLLRECAVQRYVMIHERGDTLFAKVFMTRKFR